MCTWVEVNGEVCTNQAEMMDALGTADLVPEEGGVIRQGDCLCAVDLAATAERHGYRLESWLAPGLKNLVGDYRMTKHENP